jgi:hypothetical protein
LRTLENLSRDLLTQAAFLKGREPTYERILERLVDSVRGEFGPRLEQLWAERTFNSSYERPLLLLASLRYDALCEGTTHPLHRALVDHPDDSDAITEDAFARATSRSRMRFEQALRERSVQTNETTRAVAWLWPAHLLAAAGERGPTTLVDLGTSAGLNLIADGLPALWIDEHGAPVPVEPRPQVARRLGFDISPLDVRRDDDAMWLRACVWPSDRGRLDRLEQAIGLFNAASARPDAPILEACSLVDAPARLASLPTTMFVLCVQTVVRDYLAAKERKQYEWGIREFLMGRPPCSAIIAELEVEADYLADRDRSATLAIRFSPRAGEVIELPLAQTHPHPRRLSVQSGSVESLLAAFQRP